jgi:hypothetical protein
VGKEAVVACFKLLFPHVRRQTEENHAKSSVRTVGVWT